MSLFDKARALLAALRDPKAVREKLAEAVEANSAYRREAVDLGLDSVLQTVRRRDNQAVRYGVRPPTVAAAATLAPTSAETVAPQAKTSGAGGDHGRNETHGAVVPARPSSGGSGSAKPTKPPALPPLGQALRVASYPGNFAYWCEGGEARGRGLRWGDLVTMKNVDEAIRLAREELHSVGARTATNYAKAMAVRRIVEYLDARKRGVSVALLPDELAKVEAAARDRFNKSVQPRLGAAS